MYLSRLGDLNLLLVEGFIKTDKSNKRIWSLQIFEVIYGLLIWILMIGAMSVTPSFDKCLEGPAFFTLIAIMVWVQIAFMFFNQGLVNNMLNLLLRLQNERDAKWERDMFEKEAKIVWKMVHTHKRILDCYVIGYHVVPFVSDIIVGLFSSDFPSLRVPLSLQGFIDLTEPRSLENFLVSLPGPIGFIFGGQAHFGVQGFTMTALVYTVAELKIINQRLINIKNMLNQKNTTAQTEKAERLLTETVKRHQLALESLNLLNTTFGFPIAVQSTMLSACFCVNLYGIVASESSGNGGAKLQGVGSSICLAFVVFTTSYLGEELEKQNSKVFINAYDLPWYKAPNIRHHVQLMIRQSQKPFYVNFRHTVDVSLRTFMQIINATYSYFMMLQSTV